MRLVFREHSSKLGFTNLVIFIVYLISSSLPADPYAQTNDCHSQEHAGGNTAAQDNLVWPLHIMHPKVVCLIVDVGGLIGPEDREDKVRTVGERRQLVSAGHLNTNLKKQLYTVCHN